MARYGVPNPVFKGFMVDSAQANWNAVKIVYGSRDPKVPIEGRERTSFFYWTQSLKKHIKQFIIHDLQGQQRHLCLQYCNARTVEEAETRYLAIKAWWALSSITLDIGLKHLDLCLVLWHFQYQQ